MPYLNLIFYILQLKKQISTTVKEVLGHAQFIHDEKEEVFKHCYIPFAVDVNSDTGGLI